MKELTDSIHLEAERFFTSLNAESVHVEESYINRVHIPAADHYIVKQYLAELIAGRAIVAAEPINDAESVLLINPSGEFFAGMLRSTQKPTFASCAFAQPVPLEKVALWEVKLSEHDVLPVWDVVFPTKSAPLY
jgi:hypothetical protein